VDVVFKNGNIYTVDAKKPRAEAIAVSKDRIVFVGSNADAQKFVGAKTKVVDLKARLSCPASPTRISTSRASVSAR
jgi:predicted amidohydrolase YtcJ